MGMKNLVLGGITVLFGGAIAATAAWSAELSEEQERVICQLKDTVERQDRDGKKMFFLPLLGKVREGVEAPFTAKLAAEIKYTIIGVCDDNCNGLNLTLNNTNGEIIALDEKEDGVPILSFTPPSSTDYQITARPDRCTNENCEFGMLVLIPKDAEVQTAAKIPEDLYLFQLCQEEN